MNNLSTLKGMSLLNVICGFYIWFYYVNGSKFESSVALVLVFVLIITNIRAFLKLKEFNFIKQVYLVGSANSILVLFMNAFHYSFLNVIFFIVYIGVAISLWKPEIVCNLIDNHKK